MNKNLTLAALLTLGLGAPAAMAQAGPEAAMNKAGCLACHAKDKKLVGPAYKDVAAKYKGQADAPAKLAEKVRVGSKGVWGPVPMPATGPDKISDADLTAAIEWVLKQ
jgi:cytochrome c